MIFSITTSLQTSYQSNESMIREVLLALSNIYNPLYLDKTGNYYSIIYSSLEISFPPFILQFMMSALSYNPNFVILLTECKSIASIPTEAISLSSLLETHREEKLTDAKCTSLLHHRIDNINRLINEYQKEISQSYTGKQLPIAFQNLMQTLNAMLIQETYVKWISLNKVFQAGDQFDSKIYQHSLRDLFLPLERLKITEKVFKATNNESTTTPHVDEHDCVYLIFHFNKIFLNKLLLDCKWFLSYCNKMIQHYLQNVIFDDTYMPPTSIKFDEVELQIEVEMRFAILHSVRAEFHESVVDLMLVNGIDPFVSFVSIQHHYFPFLLKFPKVVENPAPTLVTQEARRFSIFEPAPTPTAMIDKPMKDAQQPTPLTSITNKNS